MAADRYEISFTIVRVPELKPGKSFVDEETRRIYMHPDDVNALVVDIEKGDYPRPTKARAPTMREKYGHLCQKRVGNHGRCKLDPNHDGVCVVWPDIPNVDSKP